MQLLRTTLALCFILLFVRPFAQETDGQDAWPRKIETEQGTVILYQPQVESMEADVLEARAALSVTTPDQPAPVFGAMWFECRISTDRDERTVHLLDVKVSAAKFPEVEDDKVDKLIALVENEVPKWDLILSLDRLLTDLELDDQNGPAAGFNNDAPEIIFKTTPSVLILIDGDPIWEDTEQAGYQMVANTPFFLVKDSKKEEYFIQGEGHWYQSSNPTEGWANIEKPPKKVQDLAEKMVEEEDVEDTETAKDTQDDVVPDIIVRTKPAELLQSGGEPEFEPIQETSLLFMKNTDDDIIMDINSQEYYILISGRWYKSASLTSNNWAFIPPGEVPDDFANIPSDSEMGIVRSSVAGTQEAKEAVLENQIPQTAQVSREDAAVTVSYDGKPEFKSIEGTNMSYAVNTDKSVLLIDGTYYCCDNAVWFESPAAEGPWKVSVSIPDDVQDIPAECPVYNVKYVYVYNYTPTMVYVGYTPGYVHSYVYMGTVYYGTGWYYYPWYGTYYYPRPVTYGYSVHYNPYTGWGFGMTVSRGWVTVSFRSHPGYWGPSGYRHGYRHGYHHGYNRGRAAGYRAGYQQGQRSAASNNVYRSRSNGVARSGGQSFNPKNGQNITPSDRSANRQPGRAGGTNNVYTDKNGNVYKKDGNNNWQSRENGQWKDTNTGNRGDNKGQGQATNENRTRDVNRDAGNRQGQVGTNDQPRNTNQNNRQSQGQTGNYNRSGQQGQAVPSNNRAGTNQNRSYNDLNRDANSRNRGTQRSNNYNQNRQNYQYQGSGGSRTGGSRSGGGRRR